MSGKPKKISDSASIEFDRRINHIITIGSSVVVNKITRAISHIDNSRSARNAGDIGSAESALSNARALLIEILGIKES